MKRLSLAIIFTCCTLVMAAQDGAFRVNYQGANPTIKDLALAFITSMLNPEDEEPEGDGLYMYESLQNAIKGQPLEKNEKLTIDLKNGFLLYEKTYDEYVDRIEMCYWNEADGKHKLFANSRWNYENGKAILGQYDGLSFYRYDNATKKMARCNTPGFDVEYLNTTYALPRTGKNIIVTQWDENGKKSEKTLKWNGTRFSY